MVRRSSGEFVPHQRLDLFGTVVDAAQQFLRFRGKVKVVASQQDLDFCIDQQDCLLQLC